jgi:tetratricopeptide (TPR) repeat protein
MFSVVFIICAVPGSRVAFAAGGKSVYTADMGGMIARWDAANGERRAAAFASLTPVRELRPSPDGSRLFVLTSMHRLHLLDPDSLETLATLDIRGRGTNRDSVGWAMALHSAGDGELRLAVTRAFGNLLLMAPQWDADTALALVLPPVDAGPASGLANDLPTDVPAADTAGNAGQAPPSDEAAQLNTEAWEAVRLAGSDPQAVALAIHRAQRSLELSAGNPAFLNTLGVALCRDRQYERAIEALLVSLAANRRDGANCPTDTLFLAMAYHGSGRPDDAAKMLDDAREQIRDHLDRWINGQYADVMRDELHRQWAEAEQLIHGRLPEDFPFDLSQPRLEWR